MLNIIYGEGVLKTQTCKPFKKFYKYKNKNPSILANSGIEYKVLLLHLGYGIRYNPHNVLPICGHISPKSVE